MKKKTIVRILQGKNLGNSSCDDLGMAVKSKPEEKNITS